MNTCANCGHELAGSLFCTQCGTPAPEPGTEPTQQVPLGTGIRDDPDDWRTDTAERPAVPDDATRAMPPLPPADPPPATPHTTPQDRSYTTPTPPPAPFGDGPRYPMYADQIAPEPTPDQPARRGWLPWAAGAAVLLLVVVLGFGLVGGNDDPQPVGANGRAGGAGSAAGGQTDVARQATAQVPATAPPNQDLDGNMVRYEARNMLDGVPSTCWRMAGDGTGAEITFDLPSSTTLTSVGLINGYAKIATDARGQTLDWYHGNRRVLAVEWSFDDGTTVRQELGDTRQVQTLRIDPVTTQSVHLRLLTVSSPGRGRAARNYTPISDVTLTGSPA